MKASILLAAAFAATSWAAEPANTIGVHLASVHANVRGEPAGGWNNINPGIYLRMSSGLTAGAFHNSEYRTSAYAGWTFSDSLDRFAVTVGAVSGYHNGLQPLLVPSVRLSLAGPYSARLFLLVPPKGALTLHLSVERRF